MGKLRPVNKILIVLPFWGGDRSSAMKLARLLADLERGHSAEADFLFVARFDCKHDDATVKYVSRKFNVYTHVSKRRGTGWPMGCNSIFFGAMEWVYHKMAVGQIPHYRAIFVMGSDGAPLKYDWTKVLLHAWNDANTNKKVYVAGAFIPAGPHGHEHLNGDCLLLSGDLNFLKWLVVNVSDVSVPAGWDWVLAGEFKRWGWKGFSFVKSYWRKLSFTSEEWDHERKSGTVWIHGIKNDDLIDLVRKHLVRNEHE